MKETFKRIDKEIANLTERSFVLTEELKKPLGINELISIGRNLSEINGEIKGYMMSKQIIIEKLGK